MKQDIIKTSASVIVTVGVVAGTTFYSSAAQPIYIGYTTDNLNMRTGASVKYKKILEIPKGKNVEVMSGPNSSGWVKVRYGGKEGWCNGNYIKEKKLTTKYVSGARRLSLREKASTESKSLGFVYEGEKVSVVDYTGDFARIKYNNRIYYVLQRRLVSTNPAKTMYISGTRRKGLYETASTKSERLMYVYEGEKVTVVGKSGNYLHVTYDGKRGYLYNENVNSNNPAKTMYISGVWRKGLYETASTKSNQLGLVYEGEKVTVVGKSGNYLHTIYNGKRGYLYNENVISSNPVTYRYVAGKDLVEVKNGSNEISGYIAEGQKIKVFGKKDNKLRISFNGKTGFVEEKNEDYMRKYQVKVVDGISSIYLYNSKSTSGEKIAKLTEGSKVDIYEVDGEWAKIKYNGVYAYVQEKYLKDIKFINKDTAIRATKSTKGEVVSNVNKGDKGIIQSYSDGWAKIKIGSKMGYVENKYLATVKVDDGSSSKPGYLSTVCIEDPNVNKRYITKNDVEVFKEASIISDVYGYLKMGDQVEYVSTSGGYDKVKVNKDVIGYVKSSEISYRDISAKNTSTTITKKLSKTHDEYVDTQVGKPYANIDDVKYYSNPLNYNLSNNEEKYQFLKLDSYNRVNAYELNEYLNSLTVKKGQTAIFKNQADAFIKAAKKYNIDPIYLVAHTILETGYGSSKLAQGIVVDTDLAGNEIKPTKVYNLYGIGAIDSSANESGAKTAYALGWTSIPKAIDGAAKWISLGTEAMPEIGLKKSDGYIHSSVFIDQYNLYSMKWDFVKGWHQYATDPGWPLKISRVMSRLAYMYEGANLVFEKIQYAPNVETKIFDLNSIKDMVVNSDSIVRSGPSENFRNIGKKVKGDVVKVIGESDSYWVIEFETEKGYILKVKLSNIDKVKDVISSDIDLNESINANQVDEENVELEIEDINVDEVINEVTEEINEVEVDTNKYLENITYDN